MSSQPDDGAGSDQKKVPGWRQPWDTWRVTMFAGSMILLGVAISRMDGTDRLPQWAMVALYGLGFGLVGYGFMLAMRTRKALLEKKAEEKKISPRDRG